ncbi:MAG: hypothetical protein ACU0CT_03580 [Paracoccaceae bacterium]
MTDKKTWDSSAFRKAIREFNDAHPEPMHSRDDVIRFVRLDPSVIQDLPEGWQDAGQWTKEQIEAWRAEGAAPPVIPKLPPL